MTAIGVHFDTRGIGGEGMVPSFRCRYDVITEIAVERRRLSRFHGLRAANMFSRETSSRRFFLPA